MNKPHEKSASPVSLQYPVELNIRDDFQISNSGLPFENSRACIGCTTLIWMWFSVGQINQCIYIHDLRMNYFYSEEVFPLIKKMVCFGWLLSIHPFGETILRRQRQTLCRRSFLNKSSALFNTILCRKQYVEERKWKWKVARKECKRGLTQKNSTRMTRMLPTRIRMDLVENEWFKQHCTNYTNLFGTSCPAAFNQG